MRSRRPSGASSRSRAILLLLLPDYDDTPTILNYREHLLPRHTAPIRHSKTQLPKETCFTPGDHAGPDTKSMLYYYTVRLYYTTVHTVLLASSRHATRIQNSENANSQPPSRTRNLPTPNPGGPLGPLERAAPGDGYDTQSTGGVTWLSNLAS